jgi:signal transduction histidine kinase/CheY-like chemotaxis protein
MFRWLSAPTFDDVETTRRARLLHRVLVSMVLISLVGAGASLLDSRNDLRVTLLFYSLVWGWFGGVLVIVRRGAVAAAAWISSLFFWVMIAVVTLFFGGMQGQSAACFSVCTLLIGSIIGARPALWMAIVSAAWCGLVAYLEVYGKLPPQLGPYTPANAWGAVTTTLLFAVLLLQVSLDSLRRVHAEQQRTAAERDDALRKSIHGQKMELVGNLTSGIAHDLNNLLTVITGSSDILRTKVADGDSDAQGLLNDLDAAASRASLMTRQLLSFGRVRSNDVDRIDFGPVLVGMGNMLPRLLGPSLNISVKAVEHCWVMGSRSGLEQILLNLAVNARDAMPTGGDFSLELTLEDKHVVLRAKDTGVGMSQTVQERIFEPFFSTKSTGTGLGLSTVRKLVDLYGGSIDVQSKVGAGTTFRVCLPFALPAAAKSTDQLRVQSLSSSAPRRRVLLVEDDPLVRGALSRGLQKEGYEVLTAIDGVDALAQLAKHDDLYCVISDVAMPHMDGEALARHMAETKPNLPVVLISGNREPSSALIPGLPRTFLMKPVTRETLRAAILQVTANAEQHSAWRN